MKIPVHFAFTYTHYAWTEFSSNIFFYLPNNALFLFIVIFDNMIGFIFTADGLLLHNFAMWVTAVQSICHLRMHTLIKSDKDVKKIHSLYLLHIIFHKKIRSQNY